MSIRSKRVVWIDHGWQPVRIGFAPTQEAWDHAMKRLGRWGHPDTEFPETLGNCINIPARGDHKACSIVTLREDADDAEPWQIAGMFAHEALHVWRFCLHTMSERLPASEEVEAHALQHITSQLMEAYMRTRGKRGKSRR